MAEGRAPIAGAEPAGAVYPAPMTVRVTLYCFENASDLQALAEAAGGEGVTAAPDAAGAGSGAELTVGGVAVALSRTPSGEVSKQLDAVQTHLSERCELIDRRLSLRILGARHILGVTFQPGLDPAGACQRFLGELAAETRAVVSREDGSFEDPRGNPLARPAAKPKPTPQAPPPPEPEPEPAQVQAPEPAPEPEVEPSPPARDRVARRALLSTGLAWRAWLEATKPADAVGQARAFSAWLEHAGLGSEMEAHEVELARAELGRWSPRDIVEQGSAVEGAAVLGWALGLFELPPHDVRVSAPQLGAALGLFAASPPAAQADLRDEVELDWLSRRLLAIHWRLAELYRAPGPVDFERFSRECWPGGFDLTGLPLAGGDLAVTGVPVSSAPPQAVEIARGIAVERHRAAVWLAGAEPLWTRARQG